MLHNLTFRGPCIVIYSYNKSQRDALFLNFIGKELSMFWTDLLSIIRSLNTVFTAISMTNTCCREYSIKTPDDGQ